MNHSRSHALFAQAQSLIPGGVNSPVRAFKSVGGEPFFVQRADGAYLYDVDGNRYIDYVGSWGPMIAGHNHPAVREAVQRAIADGLSFGAPCEAEVTMAQTLTQLVPSCEMVRMVNSGTEATLSAIRLARGATGRSRIVKFEGCYHGHGDSFLVKAGSGMLTLGVPTSPGVPAALSELTATLSYNDFEGATALFDEIGGEIAALIIEPVVGNANCIPPLAGYLQHLRTLCSRHGALLIFDEVMTGFRVALGGAQALYGVTPDLTTFGKIIGGGMPVGAYGGRAELMSQIAPAARSTRPARSAATRWRWPPAWRCWSWCRHRASTTASTRPPRCCARAWRPPPTTPASRSPPTGSARCSACSSPTRWWRPTPRPPPAIPAPSTASSTRCWSVACSGRRRPTRPGSCPARTTPRSWRRRWRRRARPSGWWLAEQAAGSARFAFVVGLS